MLSGVSALLRSNNKQKRTNGEIKVVQSMIFICMQWLNNEYALTYSVNKAR